METELLFVIPAKEHVKKSGDTTNSSSFPRKRESRGGARKTLRWFSCGNGRLDSRFRGNDEVLFDSYCLFRCRYFRDPTFIVRGVRFLHTLESGNPEAARARLSDVFLVEPEDWIPAFERVKKSGDTANSSSFPRKRESRGGTRKTLRRFYCGNDRLDSRFRGNDEVLSVDHYLSLRRIFGGPAVICERCPISSHALPAATRRRPRHGATRLSIFQLTARIMSRHRPRRARPCAWRRRTTPSSPA